MPMDPELHQQLTAIHTSISAMGGAVQRVESKQEALADKQEELCEKQDKYAERVQANELSAAKKDTEQDGRITTLERDFNGMGAKLRGHIDHHWKHYAGTTAIVAVILAAAKAISG